MMTIALLAGFALSWLQLESLRRGTLKMLATAGTVSPKTVPFGLRYASLALFLWCGIHLFSTSLIPFLTSFILSGFILRHVYGRKIHAV